MCKAKLLRVYAKKVYPNKKLHSNTYLQMEKFLKLKRDMKKLVDKHILLTCMTFKIFISTFG